ncbi:MAG: thioredoxin domain-containing protein [Myxococcota bacterium]
MDRIRVGLRRLAAAIAAVGAMAPEARSADITNPLPGAESFPKAVALRMSTELDARGDGYVPRTRNVHADGSPVFTNRLVFEASPYLQQHAHNPVNWYPWGDEAFDAAKKLGRPVLVSIGYSTCHWCHVMEEESFDDPDLARFLNEHFIAIKVDREARPDIDAVYMAAIHAMNKRGGWPLNVWVTPDRKPFFAGTYFPPVNRVGRPGFRTVLDAIRLRYAEQPEIVIAASEAVAALITRNLEGSAASSSEVPDRAAVDAASAAILSRIDRTWGGIGRSAKFPSTVPVRFLLHVHDRTGNPEARRLVELTLDKMAAGGIRDHIGGGFHRYTTEPRWLVPHFEKMLYDNALLALAYLEAYQALGRDEYALIAADTLDYVAAEMTDPKGGFYSATDADSATPNGETEEGWFFTWTPQEIEAALGSEDAAVAIAYYGVSADGNFEGRNILHTWRSAEKVAAELATTPETILARVADARGRLYAARSFRKPPHRDEKILAAWNGLMISAFAKAGFVLDRPVYTRSAQRAAAFVLDTMRKDGRLRRVSKGGRAAGPAFLEDYAFLIAGLLDLYEADFDLRWLREAIALQHMLDEHYRDDAGGGYFKTADDQERLLAREKPDSDGAIPSGNSVSAMNLLRLSELTTDDAYTDTAVLLFSSYHDLLASRPTQLPEMLTAVEFLLDATKEIVLVHSRSGDNAPEMLAALRAAYVPNRVISIVTEGDDLEQQAHLLPLVAGRVARSGKTTAYVCENRVCSFPTNDPEKFSAQLRRQAKSK